MFNGKYISLREIIYRLKRHPLLANVEIADIAYDAIDVINLVGAPLIYESKLAVLDVAEFRTELPCDLLYTLSVGKVTEQGLISPLSSTTSTRAGNQACANNAGGTVTELQTYSVKRGYMYFDFEEGQIEVNYKAVALDSDGFPMIPDNVSIIKAIENYVKIQHFTIKVDMGEMSERPLQRAEQDYYWFVGQAQGSFLMPDIDEMESIKNSLIRIIHATNEHDYGFKYQSVGTEKGTSDRGIITAGQDDGDGLSDGLV